MEQLDLPKTPLEKPITPTLWKKRKDSHSTMPELDHLHPRDPNKLEALLYFSLLQASIALRTSVELVVLPKEHPRRYHKSKIALGKCSFVEGTGRQS